MKRILRFIRNTIKWIVVAFFASTILSVVALRFFPVYFTPLMFIRCYQQLQEGKDLKLAHHWVPLERISPNLPKAVMASEDANFLKHHGFDYKAIEHAAKRNREHPEKRKLGARIMEVYLNSIEMGEGIYGADAVAEEHFNTEAVNLSKAQCALIAATLPNPRVFSSKRPSAYMLKRQSRILREMSFVPAFPQ